MTRERGPRLLPDALTDDPATARSSLSALQPLAADVLLPGHGEPWQGSPSEAVRKAHIALG
jgi:glyoxylase-like metal-dependent hydrolase (beta-lactamase superfamily II)